MLTGWDANALECLVATLDGHLGAVDASIPTRIKLLAEPEMASRRGAYGKHAPFRAPGDEFHRMIRVLFFPSERRARVTRRRLTDTIPVYTIIPDVILNKVSSGKHRNLAGVAELADARDSKSRILHWV